MLQEICSYQPLNGPEPNGKGKNTEEKATKRPQVVTCHQLFCPAQKAGKRAYATWGLKTPRAERHPGLPGSCPHACDSSSQHALLLAKLAEDMAGVSGSSCTTQAQTCLECVAHQCPTCFDGNPFPPAQYILILLVRSP